jgi:osmotically inducible protein OsmC
MPTRKAAAEWTGNLREGRGHVTFGKFDIPYSFASRFESGEGSNPEELIGAAHAGCFSMALAAGLTKAGHNPKRVQTSASVTLDKVGEGFEITTIALDCQAEVPGIDDAAFQQQANTAKENCPVSKALKSVKITLNARLV